MPECLVPREGFSRPVPRQPAHLHTQAESGAYSRDSSRFPWRRPFIYLKSPYAIGSVPSLSGDAIAYRWRSLPRVRRHRANSPRGSPSYGCCHFAGHDGPNNVRLSFSHAHFWHEVGMLIEGICDHTYARAKTRDTPALNPTNEDPPLERNVLP